MNTNNNDPKGENGGSNGENKPFQTGSLIVGMIACAVAGLVAPAAIPVLGAAATIVAIIEGLSSGDGGGGDDGHNTAS